MSGVKQQSLLAVVILRDGAASLDEWTLLVTDSSQPYMHSKSTVVYGHAKRLSQTHYLDGVSRVMHLGYERSERDRGCVQHLREFTDAKQ